MKNKHRTTKAMIKAGGLVTDKEWPIYLFGLTGGGGWLIEKVHGFELNPITLDMLNVVTHKLSEWWREEFLETGKMPKPLTQKEFDEIKERGAIEIIIRDSEIKRHLKKDYSKDFIYKHIKKIGTIALEGKAPVKWERDSYSGNYHWALREITGGFAEVICVNDPDPFVDERYRPLRPPPRKKGRWKGIEENVYVVRLIGTWGLAFAGAVLNQRVRMLPEKFYRFLSLTEKMIFRVISGTRYSPVTFDVIQCAKMLGWKTKKINVSLKGLLISRALDNLVKYQFINSFKKEGRKDSTRWTIWKRRGWFFPLESKQQSDHNSI